MRGERRPYKKVLIIAIRKHWKDGAQMIPFGPVRGQILADSSERGKSCWLYEKWLKKLLRYHLYGKFLYIRSMKY